MAAAALLYAGAAVAAIAAWSALGDTAWTTVVNAVTFWWSLPALVLLPVALAARRRVAAAGLVVPALLLVWAYGGLFVGAPPAADADLRIATYNTYIRAPDLSHVTRLVRDETPDVLVLQEVLPRQATGLERLLGDSYPHRWFGDAGRVGGLAVLSRHPVVAVRDVRSAGAASRPTAVVVVDVGGRAVQVVPVHLTSPCPLCGASLVERQGFEAATRRAQVAAVLDALDPALPAVVAGDLNSTRRNDPYRQLVAAGFRDPQVEAGAGPGFTWPDGSGPFVRIDWVLVRDLVPAAAWVDPPRASDHRPVIVDVAFPEASR